jgi:phytoene dehydrogenase-like protein
MTITKEITLRGFKSDIHAFGYQLANTSPVPEELGLNRFGYPQISFSHIFPNTRYTLMYRSLEKTINSIRKFSKMLMPGVLCLINI